MASSMTKISSVTVGSGGAATISFTGIPQTGYTDLLVKACVRGLNASVADQLYVRFNGDSGLNYSDRYLQGNGASVSSSFGSGVSLLTLYNAIPAATATANTFGNLEFYIPNAFGSNYKSLSSDQVGENNATTAYATLQAGLWSSTSAITSILIGGYFSTIAQYSTFTLYGITKYAETGTGSKATGGTVTTAGGYTYHTFLSSGMFTPTTAITGAEVLVVAGGGGSGVNACGGGGAGGLVYASAQSYSSGVGYAAIIGAGGKASATGNGNNGINSVFASGTVAVGGGGGGYPSSGNSGGSGGGSHRNNTAAAGTAGQGNAGGIGTSAGGSNTGGGGGAGGVGGNATLTNRMSGGQGGIGSSTYSTWGSATGTGQINSGTYYYAGGGGGYTSTGSYGGFGGGGGNGGINGGPGNNGWANTGGGGGGGSANDAQYGSGGSGIVIVRYTT